MQSISIILGKRPNDGNIASTYSKYDLLGFKVQDAKDNSGVIIIDIDPESEAYESNIRKNDLINEINRTSINNTSDYNNEIKKYSSGDVIMVRIVRDGSNMYEAFKVN